jgi:hypothetical protein
MDWAATYALYSYKFRSNTSDTSYEELCHLISNLSDHSIDVKSLRAIQENLRQLLHLRSKKYDACIDGCMASAGNHILRRRCLYCKKTRFVETSDAVEEFYPNLAFLNGLTPKETYSYIPIIPRLQLLYANKVYSKKMRYPRELETTPWTDGLSGVRDVWDAEMMQSWKDVGMSSVDVSVDSE